MNSNKKLIAPETYDIFREHNHKMEEFDFECSSLPPKIIKDNEENSFYSFSYADRYELKNKDETKQRFCADAKLSK